MRFGFGCGPHFAFEPAGLRGGGGGTVTVTVVVVIVVVGVGLPALVVEGGSAGLATVGVGVVVAVSAATAPAPTMSAAHHASADVQPMRSARAIALRLIGLLTAQRAVRLGAEELTRHPGIGKVISLSPPNHDPHHTSAPWGKGST